MARASLYVLIAFSIGRIHELFEFLSALRVVFLAGFTCVFLTLLMPPAARQPVLVQRVAQIVLALAGLAATLLPLSVAPGESARFLLDAYSKLVVIFILIVALSTHPRVIRNLVQAVLTGVGLLGIFTISSASKPSVPDNVLRHASAGASYDSNDIAMMMVCTLPLAVFGALALRGGSRLAAAGVTVICVLATILTMSRGGFVGLMVVSALIIFRLRSVSARLMTFALIVGLFAVTAPFQYWYVMETIWNPTGSGYLGRGVFSRVELWERGLDLILANPLTGVGIGVYHIADGLKYGRDRGFVTAHNTFIQLGGELGILGFTLLVALFALSLRNVRRARRAAQGDSELADLAWMATAIEISLWGYVVAGFALSQAYAPMLYFLVGVATALRIQMEGSQRAAIAHSFGSAYAPNAPGSPVQKAPASWRNSTNALPHL
jgi:O-antigen ligase